MSEMTSSTDFISSQELNVAGIDSQAKLDAFLALPKNHGRVLSQAAQQLISTRSKKPQWRMENSEDGLQKAA